MTPQNILVVTGARVLDAHAASRAWGRRLVAHAMAMTVADVGLVTIVAHGNARGPDAWADHLAEWQGIARAVFYLAPPGTPTLCHGLRARPLRDAERYRYDHRDPLTRNAAMVRWAADRAADGHAVRVLALTAGWSGTGGTRHTMALARDAGLHVEHHEAPDWTWPERATSGAEGESR